MKIGIIGSGNVGSALGKIWGENGHLIRFSLQNPEKLKSLAESIGKNASYGLPEEASKFWRSYCSGSPLGTGIEYNKISRSS